MRVDDIWCEKALDMLPPGNYLVASLDWTYPYDECKKFDFIVSGTTGTGHIDNRDIPLISLQGERDFLMDVWATAEHTWALILSLVRKVPFAHNDVCAGNWNREVWQGTELRGKTLGIVGYGRVGQQVAEFAKAFGMIVWTYDGEHDRRIFHDVLQVADIITVHVPLNDETRGMFGREQFAMMKPGAYFINTSRSDIVDAPALWSALVNQKITGAAIDVMEGYNEVDRESLLDIAKCTDRLILTPHIAGNTAESREKTQLFIAERIKQFIQGGG